MITIRTLIVITLCSASLCTGQTITPEDLKKGTIFLIKFDIGSSRVDPVSLPDLDVLVEGFKRFEGLRVEVAGHTDFKGDPMKNLKLSRQRAEVVRSYLISRGVSQRLIQVSANGGTEPLSLEISEINRRVEITILQNPDLPKNVFGAYQRRTDEYTPEQSSLPAPAITPNTAIPLKKVALVIGNAQYGGYPSLKNPAHDADLMTTTLKGLGFEVATYTDLGYAPMIKAIKDFSYTLNGSDVVLFYFAGHGMQFNGENYLLPVDVALKNGANDLPFEAVNSSIVLKVLEYTNKESLNILVLDACRTTPFQIGTRSGGDGLAEIRPPTGTVVAYSTSPGAVALDGDGNNGVYTQELARQMTVPQRIEDLFMHTRVAVEKSTNGRQSPWELFRLRGVYYFAK
jgi:hypothetical protein